MPECVSSWAKYKDPQKVAQIQKELLAIYENDFAKYNGKVNSGRLKQMAGIDNSAILLKVDYQFKGQLTENYLLQQLKGQFEVVPRYFADKKSEIDFVLQYGTVIIPVEVKGGEDKSAPSFKTYIKNRQPELALRFSKMGYRQDGAIRNIPLYLASRTAELL